MGFSDWIDKAKDMLAGNKDQAKEGIDQGADMVDDQTGGKYTDQIDQGAESAKDYVEGLEEDE